MERNRILKIPEDTITQPAPEVTLKFKEQENSTAQQVCKCELYLLYTDYTLESEECSSKKVVRKAKAGIIR